VGEEPILGARTDMKTRAQEDGAEVALELVAGEGVVEEETARTTVEDDRRQTRAKRLQWEENSRARLCPWPRDHP
jgi:hypothetical protein